MKKLQTTKPSGVPRIAHSTGKLLGESHPVNQAATTAPAETWAYQVDPSKQWRRSVPLLDPWLTTSDTSWIDPIYAECFARDFQSRKGKLETTFQIIVANMAKARAELCCPVDARSWSEIKPLPSTFGTTVIGGCVEALQKHGYLTSWRKFNSGKAKHPVTYIEPTERLLERSPGSVRYVMGDDGIIRCRGFEKPADYLDNPWVFQRFHAIKDYNSLIQETPEHQLYAVYNNDFQSTGRFFGSRLMTVKKAVRRATIIDAEPLLEIDINSCHLFILLAKVLRIKLPGDFYAVDGVPRDLIKMATTMALNCKSRKQATLATQGWINESPERRQQYQGFKSGALFDILEKKVPQWEGLLYRERGLELMADEALRMSLFLEDMTSFGIKVFPVHDAVMGKVSDEKFILEQFVERFGVNGFTPRVKVKYPDGREVDLD